VAGRLDRPLSLPDYQAWRRNTNVAFGARARPVATPDRTVTGGSAQTSAEFETTQPAIEVAAYSSGRSSLTGMITSAGMFRRRAASRMASALGAS